MFFKNMNKNLNIIQKPKLFSNRKIFKFKIWTNSKYEQICSYLNNFEIWTNFEIYSNLNKKIKMWTNFRSEQNFKIWKKFKSEQKI
jgi:hypothetical protein